MNPRDFQQLARTLVASTSPAQLRTAISRAYYAAYNVGVEFLEDMGFAISKTSKGHTQVEYRLNNSGNADVKNVAVQLGTLRIKRNHADYKLQDRTVENQKNAQALVQQATNMIQTLDTCCTGAQRQEIIEAIREYLRKTSSSH